MTATATADTTLLRYGCGTAAGLPDANTARTRRPHPARAGVPARRRRRHGPCPLGRRQPGRPAHRPRARPVTAQMKGHRYEQ